ncbi:MAG: tetratricopeptide repeat protein [Treponema sp.]
MKKSIFAVIFSVFLFSLSAQNSYQVANKNTAVRCLKLAENCLMSRDWNNALKQAELGLSYDDSISDLIYVKAAALMNMNSKKADVLGQINKAFELDNWVNNKKNGARILYADLLSDTGKYEDSMNLLDSQPFIFSADAEFIRIKNMYRMGTSQSIENARLKLNSAIRIYPSDSRFANLFFMFEMALLQNYAILGINYEIPDIVKTVANYYISKLPDYDGKNLELELLASFFASSDMQNRLVRAIDSKEQTVHPLLAVAGLQVGLYSEKKAVELFFETVENAFCLSDLEFLTLHLRDSEVSDFLMEKLLNYDGFVYVDGDFDLQNEVIIEYKTGRPLNINCDFDNDGNQDFYAKCDFGSPEIVQLQGENISVYYEEYPFVSKIILHDNSKTAEVQQNKQTVLNYFGKEFSFAPVELKENDVFGMLGLDFYVPVFTNTLFSLPDFDSLYKNAISVEYPVKERENAKVVYTVFQGETISAVFLQNEKNYAFCNFSNIPFGRAVDFDDDGVYETLEQYDLILENPDASSLYEPEFLSDIFGENFLHQMINENKKIYLKKISIDRNSNHFYEYAEEYLSDNGKISFWDNNDDGIIDSKHTRFPQKNGESLQEESVFYDKDGKMIVSIIFVDKTPIKMFESDKEVLINAGENKNFYWIEDVQPLQVENQILDSFKNMKQGAVEIFESEGARFSIIKVEEDYFCKLLPESELEKDESENQTKNSDDSADD